MGSNRLVRVNELLKRELAVGLYRVMNEKGFDFSAVTVTRVEIASNLRHAKVGISIRDHQEDREAMLALIRKHRAELQEHLKRHVVLKYTPQLEFALDASIEEGDRVLALIEALEREAES